MGLWDYFQSQGQPLPSIEQRRQMYGLGQDYVGSAAQNIALLQQLQGGGGGQAPQQAPVASSAPVSGGDLWSQYQPRFASAGQQSQNLLKDYLSLSAQAPTFEQSFLDAIKQSEQYPSAAAMRAEYIQNPNLTPMAIEGLVSQRGQSTRGTIQDIINRASGGFQSDIAQKQMMAQVGQQELENLYRDYGLEYQQEQDIYSRQQASQGTEGERYAASVKQAAITDIQGGISAKDLAHKYGGILDDWELISLYNQHSPYDAMKESPQTFKEWASGGGVADWLQSQTQQTPTSGLGTGDWSKYGLDFDSDISPTAGQSAQLQYQGF